MPKPAQTNTNKHKQPYQRLQTFINEETHPPSEQGDRVTLFVRDQNNNNKVAFMVRRTTPFKKIIDAFANKVNENVCHFRFFDDGIPLEEHNYPYRIGLEDDDIIEAYRVGTLSPRITLFVRDENNHKLAFMARRNRPFKKIFDAFENKVNANVCHFRFCHDGIRLGEQDYPDRIGLKDDIIEAFRDGSSIMERYHPG